MNFHSIYFAALLMSAPPVYSGKYFSMGTCKASMNPHECIRHDSSAHLGKFILKYINFIQEQDDRCSQEPAGVDDGFEEY